MKDQLVQKQIESRKEFLEDKINNVVGRSTNEERRKRKQIEEEYLAKEKIPRNIGTTVNRTTGRLISDRLVSIEDRKRDNVQTRKKRIMEGQVNEEFVSKMDNGSTSHWSQRGQRKDQEEEDTGLTGK